MAALVARRLSQTVPVVLIVSLLVFALLRLIPGDPAQVIAGADASTEQLVSVRHDLELDQPLPVQFAAWFARALVGDLGKSYVSRRTVVELVGRAVPATLELAAAGMVISLMVGIPLGMAAGLEPGSGWDVLQAGFSALFLGIPSFLLGLLLLLLFSLELGWLPPGGRIDPAADLGGGLQTMVMPAFTLGLPLAATFARLMRGEFHGVMQQDYIRTARAKGLREEAVVVRHALRNALLPLVIVGGVQLGRLLGGTVVIELVFSWPGVGRLALQAIQARDYPLFQGIMLLLVLGAIFAGLLADIGHGLLDPRIRQS